MIVYDRLWATMKERGVSQYRLIREYRFSNGQLSRLRKNENISTAGWRTSWNMSKRSRNMNDVIILYNTWTGFTQRYAQLIGKELDCPAQALVSCLKQGN